MLLNRIEQALLLPTGVLTGTQSDEQVIGTEFPHPVSDCFKGIVTADSALRLGADFFHVPKHGLQALVSLFPGPISS